MMLETLKTAVRLELLREYQQVATDVIVTCEELDIVPEDAVRLVWRVSCRLNMRSSRMYGSSFIRTIPRYLMLDRRADLNTVMQETYESVSADARLDCGDLAGTNPTSVPKGPLAWKQAETLKKQAPLRGAQRAIEGSPIPALTPAFRAQQRTIYRALRGVEPAMKTQLETFTAENYTDEEVRGVANLISPSGGDRTPVREKNRLERVRRRQEGEPAPLDLAKIAADLIKFRGRNSGIEANTLRISRQELPRGYSFYDAILIRGVRLVLRETAVGRAPYLTYEANAIAPARNASVQIEQKALALENERARKRLLEKQLEELVEAEREAEVMGPKWYQEKYYKPAKFTEEAALNEELALLRRQREEAQKQGYITAYKTLGEKISQVRNQLAKVVGVPLDLRESYPPGQPAKEAKRSTPRPSGLRVPRNAKTSQPQKTTPASLLPQGPQNSRPPRQGKPQKKRRKK